MYWAPVLPKEMKSKVRMKIVDRKGNTYIHVCVCVCVYKGYQTGFLTNWSSLEFRPQFFWIYLTCTFTVASILHQMKSCWNKSCKSCGLIPSFIKLYPVALTVWLYSNWGWNRDQRVKLGLKDSVTWRINFIFWRRCKLKEGAEILNCYCQGPSRPPWQKVIFQNRGRGKRITHTHTHTHNTSKTETLKK